MTQLFWQAKIWGLLHDPALKALRSSQHFGDEGPWQKLSCMNDWVSPKAFTEHKSFAGNSTWLKYVGLCDLIASASDRTTIGRLPAQYSSVAYGDQGLEIRHLLSGEHLQLTQWSEEFATGDRKQFIQAQEVDIIPPEIRTCQDARKVFWWFWRCYPEQVAKDIPATHLLPADTRIPDASLWSHSTITSALAGALAGYNAQPEDYPQKNKHFKRSRPYLATFTFTPVQELIQASRKMRDLWAGSWLLHYLSAQACWRMAWKYGPDTVVYPCLYDQPLIDHWLLQKYPDFTQWMQVPEEQKLLTAGFPNIVVMLLPNNGETKGGPVAAAMQTAEQSIKETWTELGKAVRSDLQRRSSTWSKIDNQAWDNWLGSQWQTYWAALPLGDSNQPLHQTPRQEQSFREWIFAENKFSQLKNRPGADDNPDQQTELFLKIGEEPFLRAVFQLDKPTDSETAVDREEGEDEPALRLSGRYPNLNVGSWWGSIFDQLRRNLTGLKNGRTWQIPTAFGPRSTISGLGPVVHPVYDPQKPGWATEGQTHKFWTNRAYLFDGIEELNATEVVKRGLHQVLGTVLGLQNDSKRSSRVSVLYPDLSSGVAGWLKQLKQQAARQDMEAAANLQRYHNCCQAIQQQFEWSTDASETPWGIPWVAKHHRHWPNPRLLNASWLIEDCPEDEIETDFANVKQTIAQYFSTGNNPTDWYVLAVGDGDDMGGWLKGNRLQSYEDYIPKALAEKVEAMPSSLKTPFQDFLKVRKRMGPASHAALSRALLDFSNQLVPYLTEQRYAGRLIYSGGDDVLAYTNLWEWDRWLWDIRQCFKGAEDPAKEFKADGDYWQWQKDSLPEGLTERPLFTLGGFASISFGVVIAHHSVPLAIALESLRDAEKQAKKHKSTKGDLKDAVQVRVIYGNGNTLSATAKFEVLSQWQQLVQFQDTYPDVGFDPALFEQAAELMDQHPIPLEEAITPWVTAFCNRRDIFLNTELGAEVKASFQVALANFIVTIWQSTAEADVLPTLKSWLKLAAFVLRKRTIAVLPGGQR